MKTYYPFYDYGRQWLLADIADMNLVGCITTMFGRLSLRHGYKLCVEYR